MVFLRLHYISSSGSVEIVLIAVVVMEKFVPMAVVMTEAVVMA